MPQFQYKEQQFQQDAVNAVTDVFNGVDFAPLQYKAEFQLINDKLPIPGNEAKTILQNPLLTNFLSEIKNNLQEIQNRNNIQPTLSLNNEDYLMLDTHMETGTGKTFTFINTIFELHKKYNLTHFVVIVPSIAIKEGIKKSFQTTAPYFERLYQQRAEVHEMMSAKNNKGRKSLPSGIMNFVYSQHLTILIMTNHSFNRPDNIINQELEGFYADNARTPMDSIAAKNPVLIIDEPQIVEGPQTAARIKNFNPMFVLRYSATFRQNQIKNLVYVLDSYDAFHKKLVKNITVTDYKTGTSDSAFLGVQKISLKDNQVVAELSVANNSGTPTTIVAGAGKNVNQIYIKTKNSAYKDLYITEINNKEKTVIFSNGNTLKLGEYQGREERNETIITEIMLRDTIEKHLQKEQELFRLGIKCISLIFIDRVKDYRNYDSDNKLGYLQKLFEKCYQDCQQNLLKESGLSEEYREYLSRWKPKDIHGGYFSGDAKSNRKLDEGIAGKNNQSTRNLQQEISELILRDKERILNLDNELRFIFAHSALREGWDNPNVFQICKLRSSYTETSVVQEIGRGLRICVNQKLERQDSEIVGSEFSAFNRLDVFTLGNGKFISQLQKELSDRRNDKKKDFLLLNPEKLIGIYGINQLAATDLWKKLYDSDCIDEDGQLIKTDGMEEILSKAKLDPKKLLSKLPQNPNVNDAREVENKPRTYQISKTHYQQFKALWKLLHQNVVYQVKYSDNFVCKAIEEINTKIDIPSLFLYRHTGTLTTDDGRFSMTGEQGDVAPNPLVSNLPARTFLNQLTEKTCLPRNTIIHILSKINNEKFTSMQKNPFSAIQQVANIINKLIYQNIVDNIHYIKLDGTRKPETKITLTDRKFTAQYYLELNNLPNYQNNSLWEEIAPYDSVDPEKKISESALADDTITVFAKLPRAVNIPAPMHPKGINPDFAFVIRQKNGNSQFYFVAEAKPTTNPDDLRPEEKQRVEFMKKYFKGIEASNVEFKMVSSYDQLLTLFNQMGTYQ